MRRLLRLLAAAGITVGVLCIAGAVAVTTPWFKDWLRGIVVARAATFINGDVEIAGLSGSLFRDVTLRGVSVRMDGQQVIVADSISARYDVVQLILGRMSVDEVVLTRADILLVEHGDGWNLAHLIRTRDRPATSPSTLSVRRLRLVDGQVRVVPRQGSERTLRPVNLDTSLSVHGSAGHAVIDRLDVVDASVGVPLRVSADTDWHDARVSASALHLQTPSSRAGGHIAYDVNRQVLDAELTLEPLAVRDITPYAALGVPPSVSVTGQIAARGPLDRLTARWSLAIASARTTGDVTLTLAADRMPVIGTVSAANLNLREVTGRRDLESHLTVMADIKGAIRPRNLAASDLSFDVSADVVTAFGLSARNVRATGRYDSGTLRLAGSGAAYGATTSANVSVSGVGGKRAWSVNAAGRVVHVDLSRLPPVLRAPRMTSDISGVYQAAFAPGRLNAEMRFAESRLVTTTVAANSTASVGRRGDWLEATFDGSVRDLSLEVIGGARGQGEVDGEVHGHIVFADVSTPLSFTTVNGSVCAELDKLTARGRSLGRASVDASLEDGVVAVRKLTVGDEGAAAEASGVLALDDNAATDSSLTFHVRLDDLARLADFNAPDLGGTVDLTGEITGPAGAPRATGVFRSYALKYKDVATALTLDGKYRVALPGRDPAALKIDVDANSTFLRVRNEDILQVTLTAGYERRELSITTRIDQAARSLELDGSLVLLPEAREIRLRSLTFAGVGAPWHLGDEGPATIRYGQATATAEHLVLRRGEERIDASGRVALSDDGPPSDLIVTAANVDLGDLNTVLFGSPRIAGIAQGQLHLGGTRSSPIASANVALAEGAVGSVRINRVVADINAAAGIVTVDARVEPVSGSPLTARGRVPMHADRGEFDLDIVGPSIGFGLVQGFTDHVANPVGQAAIDLHVGGAMKAPTLEGTLSLADAGFDLVPTGVTYQHLQGRVRFEHSRAVIDELSIQDSDGHVLHVTGGADARIGEANRTFDLRVDSDGVHVLNNRLGELAVRLGAVLDGSLQAPKLAGRVDVTRGRLEVDAILRQFTGGPASTSPAPSSGAAAPASPGIVGRTAIDLDVVMPDDVVLRGSDLRLSASSIGLGNINITVGGTLKMTKSPGERAVLVGSAEVIRGFYDFQGRRFDVNRGSTVTFRSATLDPSLDVSGEREVSGVVAQVRITGTVTRPNLVLSSRPPLDEADVLSLIIFNQPANQLGDSERLDLADRASALAAGAIATSVANSIGRVLDVDLFEIRAPGSGEAGEVRVGRQVNERLFVGFRQQFGEAEASRLSFEYRITEALRVVTSVAQGTDRTNRSRDAEVAGADFVYVVKY